MFSIRMQTVRHIEVVKKKCVRAIIFARSNKHMWTSADVGSIGVCTLSMKLNCVKVCEDRFVWSQLYGAKWMWWPRMVKRFKMMTFDCTDVLKITSQFGVQAIMQFRLMRNDCTECMRTCATHITIIIIIIISWSYWLHDANARVFAQNLSGTCTRIEHKAQTSTRTR